jgi:PAS domain S-box-containing protein
MILNPLSPLATRLSVIVALVVLCTVVLLGAISFGRLREFGTYAVEQNRAHGLRQAERFLLAETTQRARHYQSVFRMAEVEAEAIADRLEQIAETPELYAASNYNPGETLTRNPANGVWTNQTTSLASCVWWNAERPGPEALKAVAAYSHVDPELRRAARTVRGAAAAWFISPSALARYYPNIHHVDYMPPPAQYDYRDDLCFLIATPERNPERRVVWHEVYQDTMGQGLVITVSAPAYAKDGSYVASAGIDISLDGILEELVMADNGTGPPGAFNFVLDGAGRIIAFPMDRLALFGIEWGEGAQAAPGTLLKHTMADSANPEVAEAARVMGAGVPGVVRLGLGGEAHLLAFHPMGATGWTLARVIPEASLLGAVQRTRTAIDDASAALARRMFWVALTVLVVALGTLLLLLTRGLFRPLAAIAHTVGLVAEGDLAARSRVRAPGELAALSRAVDDMAARLEEQHRSLRLAEEEWRNLFGNAMSGLFRTSPDTGRLLAGNQALADMYGYASPEEMAERVPDMRSLLTSGEDAERLGKELREQGTLMSAEVRSRRADGAELWIATSARMVRDEQGEPLYVEGSAMDITDRKRAEHYRNLLSRELIRIQENERRRLAVDLHDHLAQDLSALKISLEMLFADEAAPASAVRERAAECLALLGQTIAAVRGLAQGLGPYGLNQFGLGEVLRGLCEGAAEETGMRVDYQASGLASLDLPLETSLHVYRIVQEALTNIRRHAGAGEVKVRLVASHPQLILRVEDNGRGFAAEERMAASLSEGRLGLVSIHERASLLGGTVEIVSVPGRGTRIIAVIPVGEHTADWERSGPDGEPEGPASPPGGPSAAPEDEAG